VVGICVDANVFAGSELAEGPHRRDLDDLHFLAEPILQGDLRVVSSA
jgi:hypothetical protein